MGINSFLLNMAQSQVKGLAKTTAASVTAAARSSASNIVNRLSQGDIGALDPSNLVNGDLGANLASGGVAFGDAAAGMAARSDAIQNWSWYCLLPTLTNNNTFEIFGSEASTPLAWYYVQKANLPQRTIQAESIKRNGHTHHLPTEYSVPNLSLDFFMDTSNRSQKYLKAWASLVLNSTNPSLVQNQGVWGMPATYKKNISIYVLSAAKKQLLIYKYLKCWPSDPAALELGSSDPAALFQTVSFYVEDVDVTVLNDKGLIDNLIETAQGYGLAQLSGFAPRLFGG